MKILSCNISAFGNISDAKVDFKSSIVETIDYNGTGKTTVSEFIRCMLYGMKTTSTKDSHVGERLHYLPFNSSNKYGGTLTISVDDRVYNIQRVFDKSSKTRDTIKITDEKGNEIKLSEGISPGDYFFGIDDDAFRRTVFFSNINSDPEAVGTEAINSKMDVIVSKVDTNKFDAIIKDLTKRIGEIKSSGNSARSKAKINILQQEIEKCNDSLNELDRKQDSLDAHYTQYKALEAEHKNLKERLDAINSTREKLLIWKQLDKTERNISENFAALEQINQKYPYGTPSTEDINVLKEANAACEKANSKLEALNFSDSDMAKLKDISEKYPKGFPTLKEIEGLGRLEEKKREEEINLSGIKFTDDTELSELTSKFSGVEFDAEENKQMIDLLNQVESDTVRLDQIKATPISDDGLSGSFANGLPDKEVLKDKQAKAQQYYDNKTRIEALIGASVTDGAKSSSMTVAIIVLGILLISGIALLAFGIMAGLALVVISAVGALVLALKHNKAATEKSKISNELIQENAVIESGLTEYFSKYGLFGKDFRSNAERLSDMLARYEVYLQKKESRDKEISELEEKINTGNAKLKKYLSAYGINEISESALGRLSMDFKRYNELKSKKATYEHDFAQAEKELVDTESKLKALLSRYDIFDASAEKILTQKEEFESLKARKQKYEDDKSKCLAEISKYENIIKDISSKYALDTMYAADIVSAVQRDSISIEHYDESIKRMQDEIKSTKAENGLIERPQEIDESEVVSISDAIEKIKKDLSNKDDEIRDIEESIEKIPNIQDSIQQYTDEVKRLEYDLEVLKKTKTYLIKADDAIRERLIGPIKEKYQNYMMKILPQLANDIYMGNDYRIRLKGKIDTYDKEHLSQGEITCLELCLRIALIDNMYKTEKPFLVFDDPFTELDEKNLKLVKELLKELADEKGYQILYFTCHKSRSIGA